MAELPEIRYVKCDGRDVAPSEPARPPEPRPIDRLVTAARRAPRVLTALNRLDSALSRRRT